VVRGCILPIGRLTPLWHFSSALSVILVDPPLCFFWLPPGRDRRCVPLTGDHTTATMKKPYHSTRRNWCLGSTARTLRCRLAPPFTNTSRCVYRGVSLGWVEVRGYKNQLPPGAQTTALPILYKLPPFCGLCLRRLWNEKNIRRKCDRSQSLVDERLVFGSTHFLFLDLSCSVYFYGISYRASFIVPVFDRPLHPSLFYITSCSLISDIP